MWTEGHLIRCIQTGEVSENVAPVIASETPATLIPYDEDPFLDCDDLEEDKSVVDDK